MNTTTVRLNKEATTTPPALSAEEAAIESGKQVMHGTVTDWVQKLLAAIKPTKPPRVTLDRAVRFTETFVSFGSSFFRGRQF